MTMDEQQWLDAADPQRLLAFLEGKASARKLRLFAAACCRRVWHLVDRPALRAAVEAAERFADGQATDSELAAAWEATFRGREHDGLSADPLANARFWAADAASQAACELNRADMVADSAAVAVCWESGGTARVALDRGRAAQCALLRCLFGCPPHGPAAVDPAWLERDNGVVRKVARSIRECGSFEDLPVLADALEDCGCDDEGLLAHLRDPGPHARGCHVLDLLGGSDR
jgi:hypothetical protein